MRERENVVYKLKIYELVMATGRKWLKREEFTRGYLGGGQRTKEGEVGRRTLSVKGVCRFIEALRGKTWPDNKCN